MSWKHLPLLLAVSLLLALPHFLLGYWMARTACPCEILEDCSRQCEPVKADGEWKYAGVDAP